MTDAGYVPYEQGMLNPSSDLSAPIKPRDRLLQLARIWSDRTGRSHGALSAMVMNHGGALERLRDPAKSVTDGTLERFARWMGDPANWPEGAVPREALEFAHVTGVALPSARSARENGQFISAQAQN